jgi:hypothetical protein
MAVITYVMPIIIIIIYIYIYIRALGPVHQLHHVHRSAYLTDTPLSDLIEAEGEHKTPSK